MRLYEFEYRQSPADLGDDAEPNWRTIAERPREGIGSYVIDGLDLGVTYDVRVRLVDEDTGEASDWVLWPGVEVEKDGLAPDPVESFRLTKNDCATWELDREVLDLRGFLIRHAPGAHGGDTDDGWLLAERAHEEVVGAPPFLLCRVPKGPRTLLIRPLDWDDNEGDPVVLYTDRGPLNDAAEYAIATADEAAGSFGGGTVVGATVPASTLQADAVTEATADQPMFPDGIEPWMSVDDDAPMFPVDEDAPMFGEIWGKGAEWFGRDPSLDMFGGLQQWIEYVWSYTLHSGDGGPGAVLSLDCESDGVAWRLMYRVHHPQRWLDANPYAPFFDPDTSEPMFPLDTPKAWRPWPGRLLDAAVGRYDFRLIVPGGHESFACSALSVTYSRIGRTERTEALSVPALGGTRAAPVEPWRKIVEVDTLPVGVETEHVVAVGNISGAKGPELRVTEAGSATTAPLNVTIRGY